MQVPQLPSNLALTSRIWTVWTIHVVLLCVTASPLRSQTVRPLIDENIVSNTAKRASGKIEYFNDSLQTLYVVLEAQSFTVDEKGDISYRPLDGNIHLRLSSTSFKIPPRQSYYVFYQASADKLPSWFVIYAAFSGFREKKAGGFRIQLQLPHTIYLLPKRGLNKEEVNIVATNYDPHAKTLTVRVSNSGESFGRVLEASAAGKKAQSTQGGFPVFPNSQRQVEIPWDFSNGPEKIVLRFDRFSLQRDLRYPAQE